MDTSIDQSFFVRAVQSSQSFLWQIQSASSRCTLKPAAAATGKLGLSSEKERGSLFLQPHSGAFSNFPPNDIEAAVLQQCLTGILKRPHSEPGAQIELKTFLKGKGKSRENRTSFQFRAILNNQHYVAQ